MTADARLIDRETIEKLDRLINENKVTIFTEQEVNTIRSMIHIYQGFEAFGRMAGAVKSVVIWFGAMAAAFYAFREFAVHWVQGVGGK